MERTAALSRLRRPVNNPCACAGPQTLPARGCAARRGAPPCHVKSQGAVGLFCTGGLNKAALLQAHPASSRQIVCKDGRPL